MLGTTVFGTTYFVDCNRSDNSGNGLSEVNAKRTIPAAVDAASANDIIEVIQVAPGVYEEGTTSTPGGHRLNRVVRAENLTIQSDGGARTTIIQGAVYLDGVAARTDGSDSVSISAPWRLPDNFEGAGGMLITPRQDFC